MQRNSNNEKNLFIKSLLIVFDCFVHEAVTYNKAEMLSQPHQVPRAILVLRPRTNSTNGAFQLDMKL